MDERRKDLCLYRMKKARNCLESANILMQSGDYCGAAKRQSCQIFPKCCLSAPRNRSAIGVKAGYFFQIK